MRYLVLIGALALSTAANSAVIFSDNFDSEAAPGLNVLNYGGYANWTVTAGSVDLVAQVNPYGIANCTGKCVDLAGTPGPGAITSKPIAFSAGNRVDVSFSLSGNQRTSATDSFTFSVAFAPANAGTASGTSGPAAFIAPGWIDALNGTPYNEAIVGTTPFVTYSGWFIPVIAGTFQLTFAGGGGGNANIGPILDNVLVTQVPEPTTWAMLIAGFGLVGFAARRRRQASALA